VTTNTTINRATTTTSCHGVRTIISRQRRATPPLRDSTTHRRRLRTPRAMTVTFPPPPYSG